MEAVNHPKDITAKVIDDLGGSAALARKLGVGASTVTEMKRRGNFPGSYWHALEVIAHDEGQEWITADYLARVYAKADLAPMKESAND